jgi:hypothetical protein
MGELVRRGYSSGHDWIWGPLDLFWHLIKNADKADSYRAGKARVRGGAGECCGKYCGCNSRRGWSRWRPSHKCHINTPFLRVRYHAKKTPKSHANLHSDAIRHCLYLKKKSPAAQVSGGSARLPHLNDCSKPVHNYFLRNLYWTRSQLISGCSLHTMTFANRPEPGSLRKRCNFHLRLSAKRILLYFRTNSDRFRTRPGAVRRPCTMNVQNEPVHEFFCVVEHETPSPYGGENFVSFIDMLTNKSI